jgi:hypothetical protein
MRPFQASLFGALLAFSLAVPVRGDSPDEAKLKRDQSDCRRWAAQHTHFDPNETTSDTPRPPIDPPLGHAPGIAIHDAAAAKQREADARRRNEMIARKQRAQDEADLEARRAVYERAVKTCVEGRTASVGDHSTASIGESSGSSSESTPQ